MMRYLIIAFLLVLIFPFPSPAGARERTVVAKVDGTPIYKDEVLARTAGSSSIDDKITALRQLIIDEITRAEIAKRGINPSDKVIRSGIKTQTEQQSRFLDANESVRVGALARAYEMNSKLTEGLELWRSDPKKGDEFAITELAPLGIDKYTWEYVKTRANDPGFTSTLGEWKNFDSIPNSEKNELLLRTHNEVFYEQIKHAIAIEELSKQITPDATVTALEVRTLYNLTEGTEWIEVVAIQEADPDFRELRNEYEQAGMVELPRSYDGRKRKLSGAKLRLGNPNLFSAHELYLLAIHNDSLQPGSLSSVITWPGTEYGKDLRFMYYISDRGVKDTPAKFNERNKKRLRGAIGDFKRKQQFVLWMRDELPKRATIVDPAYASVLGKGG